MVRQNPAQPFVGRLILFAALLALLPLLLGFNFPRMAGFVTDSANLLTPQDRATLETDLRSLKKDTGWEVAVVTVPNLEGATIERYAQDLFISYGIGEKGTDNGVLLIIGRQERKVRIHTGYHAESVVTDAVAKRIISEVIAPKTKTEDWSGGITDGAHAVIKLIRDPAHNPTAAVGAPTSGKMSAFDVAIFLIVVITIIIFLAIIFKQRAGHDRDYFSGGGSWGGDSGGDSGDSGGFGGGDSGGGGASGDC